MGEIGAEPKKIGAGVVRGLIEGEEQSVGSSYGGGVKGLGNEAVEFGESERGELRGVVVIESEERLGSGV